ncbi:gp060 [Erwinia phage vB_EamP-S6]|uniref:Gp060 n=1 Tax=Erwinia phage vB_EamP-S6 TaxID=1051675 RepID=G0YQF2_9CAUD|nr:gp060 [Erwinia phage vB_EamP-S6]AEJ81579.1 gp060 [Erwinia phage vB_EamP-S6]
MAQRRWTRKELDELETLAVEHTVKQLAAHFGRTYLQVMCKCSYLGIKPVSEKARWPSADKQFILDNYHLSIKQLAAATGHPEPSVRRLLCDVYGPRWRRTMKSNLEVKS